MAKERLQKILSAAGLGSRRACEKIIEAGRVSVDGVAVTRLGAQADPHIQTIMVDGTPLKLPRKHYFLLNKPVGYLCSNKTDASDRPLAVDLIRRAAVRLYCAGRLDVDSKGAIILTNDGAFSNYITHPRYNVVKVYRVRVEGSVGPEVLVQLKKGIWLHEGKTGAIDAKILRSTRRDTLLRLVLKEGKNRVIRRALAKLDLRVTELERTRIGSIALGKLRPGQYRELKPVEIKKLMPKKHGAR